MRSPGFGFPHLYLSVPAGGALPADRWAEALLLERKLRADAPALSTPLRSLFVGGGAPERLGSGLADRVRRVTGREALEGIGEWTVEVSEPRIEAGVLRSWISGGVTRLSLRGPAAVPSSVARIAELSAGRVALGVDLPLAAVEPANVRDRVVDLIGLGVGSVAFIDEEPDAVPGTDTGTGTGTGTGTFTGPPPVADSDGTRDGWIAAVEAVRGAGWSFLDLAFAFGAAPCPVHPRAIVRRNPVLGLGPGAVTFRHPNRRWNQAGSAPYVEAIERSIDPVEGQESLTRAQGRFERCWSSLRSARGLRLSSPSCSATPWLERWRGAGWVRSGVERVGVPGRLRLAPEGWLMADGLAIELAIELERIRPGGSTDHPEFQSFEE